MNAKDAREVDSLVKLISTCLSNEISPERLQEARAYADSVRKRQVEFEAEEFSILELACAGFTVKEVLAFSATQGAAAAAGTTTVSAAAGPLIAAALGGWLLGESLMALDAQTGNNFRRAFSDIADPIVYAMVGVPSKADQLKVKVKTMALRFVIAYREKKFGV